MKFWKQSLKIFTLLGLFLPLNNVLASQYYKANGNYFGYESYLTATVENGNLEHLTRKSGDRTTDVDVSHVADTTFFGGIHKDRIVDFKAYPVGDDYHIVGPNYRGLSVKASPIDVWIYCTGNTLDSLIGEIYGRKLNLHFNEDTVYGKLPTYDKGVKKFKWEI